MKWTIPPLSSGGIILSYQCSNRCRHCLYASSPEWKEWIKKEDIDKILKNIRNFDRYLTGIHIGGGEPMLRPDLVSYTVKKATDIGIPLDYVETNAFWCWNDEKTEEVFQRLKEAGLHAVLISISPFHLEFVPMEKAKRAVRVGKQVFGEKGVIIYTDYFFKQFQELDEKYPLPLQDYLDAVGTERASLMFATEYGLIPNGRAAVMLTDLYEHRPAFYYFNSTCEKELLSPYHIHIDLYGNYIAGLCSGISLGDGRRLDVLYNGSDFEKKPFLKRMIAGGIGDVFDWAVEKYGYKESPKGYIAKCQLCLDIRRHLVKVKANLAEITPLFFYKNLC